MSNASEELPEAADGSMSALRVIREWKLEAKLEDVQRYFFYTEDVRPLESGERCYVTGRKGTGKTAISEFLRSAAAPERFSKKLSFKNFPFNMLYDLKDTSYTPPNRYISLWKILIYSSVLEMMCANENISARLPDEVLKAYRAIHERPLRDTISTWTSITFGVDTPVGGASVAVDREVSASKMSPTDKCDSLECLIGKYGDDSSYYVVFDELDEDYRRMATGEQDSTYVALLTSLFKAVQDVKSAFRDDRVRVRPIVFLRDDIYDWIEDNDKTKWSDFRSDLHWGRHELEAMLAHRISRSIDPDSKPMSFAVAWGRIAEQDRMPYAGSEVPLHDPVLRSGFLRPRDAIKFLKLCAEKALARGRSRIDRDSVVGANATFSRYMRDELVDEVRGALPDIGAILNILSDIGTQQFEPRVFTGTYRRALERGLVRTMDPVTVLQALFYFSAVGNYSANDRHVWRFESPTAALDPRRSMIVHDSLVPVLRLQPRLEQRR